MTGDDARESAWSAVHEALPARWHGGPVTCDPGLHAWSVTAHGSWSSGWL